MASDAVYSAVKTYLEANGASLADPVSHVVPQIEFENEDLTRTVPDAPWVAMSMTGGYYGQESMGAVRQADNRWDEKGDLWFAVLVKSGSGAIRARQIAKQLCDLFRGQQLLNDSLEFLDSFISSGGPSQRDGGWYEIPVQIKWHRVEA